MANEECREKVLKCLSLVNVAGIPLSEKDVDSAIFEVFEIFCRHVLNGRHWEISFENDPPWDHSGSLSYTDVAPSEYLKSIINEFETIGEWSDDTYTGESEATFLSGCGLSYNTFSRIINDTVESSIFNRVKNLLNLTYEKNEEEIDTLSDSNELLDLESEIVGYCCSFSPEYCWGMVSDVTMKKIAQEKFIENEENIRREAQQAFTNSVVTNHFSEFRYRIEGQNKHPFIDAFAKFVSVWTLEELQAIERSHLKLNLSNSIRNKCMSLVRDEIRERLETASD